MKRHYEDKIKKVYLIFLNSEGYYDRNKNKRGAIAMKWHPDVCKEPNAH